MRNNRGFTIIELMATMIIVTIGVVGAYSVVQQILAITSSASQRLTAAYLAQEGIELVRNIRDTNWVEGSAWNQGLANGDWEMDYNDSSLLAYNNRNLLVNNNLYNYDSGVASIYKRKINLNGNASSITVSVEMEWSYNGSTHTLTAEGEIYDWK